MKLSKAIEILDQYVEAEVFHDLDDFVDAVRLGREALKTYLDVRRFLAQLPFKLLPGETEEEAQATLKTSDLSFPGEDKNP